MICSRPRVCRRECVALSAEKTLLMAAAAAVPRSPNPGSSSPCLLACEDSYNRHRSPSLPGTNSWGTHLNRDLELGGETLCRSLILALFLFLWDCK